MNINTKVTAHISKNGEYLIVYLYFNNICVDHFIVNTIKKEIIFGMQRDIKVSLNIEDTYEDYMKLLKDLGPTNLEIPEEFKKHWTPKDNDTYYFLNRLGEVVLDTDINSFFQIGILENYNAIPTEELAEKSIKSSKLGRLILLWQYTNNCIFTPDWDNFDQPKHSIIYDVLYKDLRVDMSYVVKGDKVYFKTEEQAQAFIDMYEAEIKELMNIK